MLTTTNVPIKTEDGREALAARRHDMQVRQRHLLILIDGARTVGQLHQLLNDWSDLDDLLVSLQRAGMVDILQGTAHEEAPAPATPEAPSAPEALETPAAPETPAVPEAPDAPEVPEAPTETFDPIAYFNRPLFDDAPAHDDTQSAIDDEPPPLTGMTLGLQTVAAPDDPPAANDEPSLAPIEPPVIPAAPAAVSQPPAAPDIPDIPDIPDELADVLPSVVKVELMRLAITHFGSAASATMPLLRASSEDTQALCDVIAACAKAAGPAAGEHATARFVDAAMRAMAQRR